MSNRSWCSDGWRVNLTIGKCIATMPRVFNCELSLEHGVRRDCAIVLASKVLVYMESPKVLIL